MGVGQEDVAAVAEFFGDFRRALGENVQIDLDRLRLVHVLHV
jgi:hypothetical protein